MQTRAAVLWDRHKDWSVEEIELDPPKAGEVLVASGRQRAVPLRRARPHRRLALVAAHRRWPRGRRGGPGGRAGRDRPRSRRPGDLQLPAGLRPLSSLRPGHEQPLRAGHVPRYRDADLRPHGPPPRPRPRSRADVPARDVRRAHVVSSANCIKIEDDLPLDVACLSAAASSPAGARSDIRRRGSSRGHGGRRRSRGDRHQRGPRRRSGGRRVRRRGGPGGLQAGQGTRARRHPRRWHQRGGHCASSRS